MSGRTNPQTGPGAVAMVAVALLGFKDKGTLLGCSDRLFRRDLIQASTKAALDLIEEAEAQMKARAEAKEAAHA